MDKAREIARCETVDDVLALLDDRDGWAEPWQTFFADILDASGLSYARFATRCGQKHGQALAARGRRAQKPRHLY